MHVTRPDDRLGAAASFVRQGAVFADIGTDHAHLPIFLLENGREPAEAAGDISLAAYLLSANMTSYDIPSLCSVYSIPYLSFPELMGGDRLSKAAAIKPLSELLSKLLDNID